MKAASLRSPFPSREGVGAPEDHVGYLLKRLQHSVRQAVDESLREAGVGLSFAHVATLFCLSHHPGISGAQIAKRTMVTAQTVNSILHRLEKEDLLERRPHPDNRRVDRWYVTSAGRASMGEARAAAGPVWNRMLAPLSEVELGQLRGFLKRCIQGLERAPRQADNIDAPSARRRRTDKPVHSKKNPKGRRS